MLRSLTTLVVALLFVATALAGTARGDTIVIREGSATFDTGDPLFFSLLGGGFALRGGSTGPSIATSGAFACAPRTLGCMPSTRVDLSSVFGSALVDFNLGRGHATIGDQTYGAPDPENILLRGTFAFDTPSVVIPDAGQMIVLTALFAFTGAVAGFDDPDGSPLFQVDLRGRGRATMHMQRFNGLYEFASMGYAFEAPAPIPEPATLVFIGSGLAGLLVRSRRAKRR